jgi:hypothetical protein
MKSWNKQTILGLVLVLGSSMAALGQAELTSTNAPSDSFWDRPPLYRSQEFSLDLFGTGAVGQNTLNHLTGERFVHHVRLGLGAGGNYFFTRYLGLGVEADSESTHHSFVNDVSGDFIFRFPIGDTIFAPYAFAGGGREFVPFVQWEGHAGAGVEFRVWRHFSFFIDGRYIVEQTSQNYGMGRLGVRLSF